MKLIWGLRLVSEIDRIVFDDSNDISHQGVLDAYCEKEHFGQR